MSFDYEMYKQEVQYYFNTKKCPKCYAEVDQVSSGHERDSSNDTHECTKCDWKCGEMSLWGLEKTPQE